MSRARHVVARGVSLDEASEEAHIHLSVVARVPGAHAGAVLALAALDDPDPDARFPWFVSTSVDGTVSTWHVEERGAGGIELVRDASFGDDDAPWWCLAVDDEWLFAGTHGRKVKVRLAVDADLETLPGAIANHTGWVRALAFVRKTPRELERAVRNAVRVRKASLRNLRKAGASAAANDAPPPPTTGDTWRFSAACNVVRVWQDSFAFDEDDEVYENGGAVADVGSARIFTGDILCLAGVRASRSGDRFLIAGVADGTVRGWRVCEGPNGTCDAPVMLPIVANGIAEEESLVTRHETNPKSAAFADLRGGRVAALFPLSDAFPDDDVLSRFVVAGCRDGTLGCVDAETLSVSPRIAAHERRREDAFQTRRTKGVACVCAGPKNTVASGGDDGIVRLWRPRVRCSTNTHTCVVLEPAGDTVCPDVFVPTRSHGDRAAPSKKKKKTARGVCARCATNAPANASARWRGTKREGSRCTPRRRRRLGLGKKTSSVIGIVSVFVLCVQYLIIIIV